MDSENILEGHLASSRFNFFGELLLQYSKLNYYNYILKISNFGDIMVFFFPDTAARQGLCFT